MNHQFASPEADYIRKLVLTNWQMIHGLMISAEQRRIYNLVVKHGNMDSVRLSLLNDRTHHVAGQQLRTLYERGYLSRHHEPNGTGGTFYVYTPLVVLGN